MRIEIRCRIMNFYLSYLYTVTIGGISSSIISSVPRNESPDICQSHTGNSINCSLFMPLFDKLSWQTIESIVSRVYEETGTDRIQIFIRLERNDQRGIFRTKYLSSFLLSLSQIIGKLSR